MIYEINGKFYIKIDNYFKEVQFKYGRVKIMPNCKKLYFSEVDKTKVKEYTVKEYLKKPVKED